jgi:hypothetical protein
MALVLAGSPALARGPGGSDPEGDSHVGSDKPPNSDQPKPCRVHGRHACTTKIEAGTDTQAHGNAAPTRTKALADTQPPGESSPSASAAPAAGSSEPTPTQTEAPPPAPSSAPATTSGRAARAVPAAPAEAALPAPLESPVGEQGRAGAPTGSAAVAAAARSFIPLFLLMAAALVFLALQGRLDRRDPKLAAAPLDDRGDFLPFR